MHLLTTINHPITRAEIIEWETDTTENAPDTDLSDANDFVNNNSTSLITTRLPYRSRPHHRISTHRHTRALAGTPPLANYRHQNQPTTKHSKHNAHPSPKPTLPAAISQPRTSLRHPKAAHAAFSVALKPQTTMNRRSSALRCWMLSSRCSVVSTTTRTTMGSGEPSVPWSPEM